MGLFKFLKDVGQKLGIGDEPPKAEDLKKSLDSHKLGTDGVQVKVVDNKVVLTGEVKDRAALEKAVLAVGNAQGIDSVDTEGLKVSAPAAEPESTFYEVKSGDNLWKIAERHYGKGNGAKNDLIFEANRPMLTSPDKIYPGQTLRIPPLK
jgi:nucleoid-associated protein YgaU